MIMPFCADGVTDMFEPSPWNVTAYLTDCQQQWGVHGDPEWVMTQYGGRNIKAASNIIFRLVKSSKIQWLFWIAIIETKLKVVVFYEQDSNTGQFTIIEINSKLEVFVQISKTDVGFGNDRGRFC